jgi:hypothetical protein
MGVLEPNIRTGVNEKPITKVAALAMGRLPGLLLEKDNTDYLTDWLMGGSPT